MYKHEVNRNWLTIVPCRDTSSRAVDYSHLQTHRPSLALPIFEQPEKLTPLLGKTEAGPMTLNSKEEKTKITLGTLIKFHKS